MDTQKEPTLDELKQHYMYLQELYKEATTAIGEKEAQIIELKMNNRKMSEFIKEQEKTANPS